MNKALRLQKIESAMRGQHQSSETIKTCLADFETLSKSWYAESASGLDAFLRELEKTGLVTALAEQATLQRRYASVEREFLKLHEAVFGTAFTNAGRLLYGQMSTAFEVSLATLTEDPALALTLRTLHDSIEAKMLALEERVIDLTAEKCPFEDYELLNGFMQRLAKSLAAHYKSIRIETNKGAKLVDLQRIYIPSKLRQKKETEVAKLIINLTASEEKQAKSPGSVPSSRTLEEGVLSFSELCTSLNRAVVLGDPGGGKSTLCQYLCHQFAKNYGLVSQYPEATSKHVDLQSARIPVRIILRHFELARTKDPQLGMFEFIVREAKSLLPCSDDEARYALSFGLSLGKIILAFDGLDEILNTGIRREYVDIVIQFCDQYPLCPVLVTSRVVGYDDASLPPEFDELFLERFAEAEIRAFVEKFLRVVGSLKPDDARSDADRFMRQTASTAQDLRQNPLMLGLMAFLFANKGDVPTNRPEIYQECAILMFEKWDANRNIKADVPVGFNLLDLLGEIASQIYGDLELEEGVGRSWLQQTNEHYFRGMFESIAKANDAAKKVTDFLTGRSWVMSEFGVDVYRFTHRTFLEYFVARHLNEEHDTVRQLLVEITPKIIAKHWDVISHLALQIKTFRSQRRIAQAIKEISSRLDGAEASDLLVSQAEKLEMAKFAADALQYLMGSEGDIRLLIELIYEVCAASFVAGSTLPAATVLAACCACIADRRDYVIGLLCDHLTSTVISENRAASDFALGVVSAAVQRDRLPFAPRSGLSFPPDIARGVAPRIKKVVEQRAEQDAFYARIHWELYGTKFEKHFQVHGFAMLFAERRPMELVPFRSDPGLDLIGGWQRPWAWSAGQYGGEVYREAIRTVGRLGKLDWKLPAARSAFRSVYTNPQFWIRALPKPKQDADALRGLLLCMAIHGDFIANASGHSAGRWPFMPRNNRSADEVKRLVDTIDAAINAISNTEKDRFAFWQTLKEKRLTLPSHETAG